MRRFLFAYFLLIAQIPALAQSVKNIIVSPSDNGKVLSDLLREMEARHGVDFICDEQRMRSYTIAGVSEKKRLLEYLDDYLAPYTIFRYSDNVTFIVDRAASEKYDLKRENFLLFPGDQNPGIALTGIVRDALTSSPLIGAKVHLPSSGATTITDVEGSFNAGIVTENIIAVNVGYIGYEPNHYIIGFSRFGEDTTISAALLPESRELQSVTITADRVDENVKSQITGIQNLSIATMRTMPAFLGEVDPIRSLTTLPGVSTTGELASGYSVRGGESGQNLVVQDGAIIYNPSHLFGFFSAFNPDLVSSVTLYKGGGPANFGSRISSVLDVSLRNGNASKHTVSAGLGLVSSRLTVEGPIVRNKSSYLVGGRVSYANWLVKATDQISLRNSGANFHDITGKIFHTIDERNYLTFSAYHSYDDFKLATDSVFSWQTTNFSVKWDHTFDDRSFSTLTLASSSYASEVNSISEIEGFKYRNGINNIRLKYDFSRALNDESKFVTGIEANATLLEPGERIPNDKYDNVSPENMQDQRSLEAAVFVQWDRDLNPKWSVSAGLRFSYFARLGEEEIYVYDYSRMQGRYPGIADTLSFGSGEIIDRYSGLEPRISVRYIIAPGASLKASYYRGYQYLHLISNTSSTTPQDYWITSGPHLKPQSGDQYSFGVFRNLQDNRYEVSLEGFYKEIQHAVDYIEGADITLNPVLEGGLSQGDGLAYGTEFLLKKNTGRTTGWLSYTWSRSLRRFTSQSAAISINEGKYYPSNFDQPHHVSLVLNHQLSPRSFLSANFHYSTGRPITIPVSKFSYDVYLSVLNYSARNDYRIPDYHRLDLSLTIRDKPRSNKRINSEWVISLFNVYSRKNTYSISFTRYGTASKLAVLGTIFPSVNYNIRF